MKRFISIAVCSLAIVSNAGAQGLGDILGTILGVVKEVSSAIPEGNESSVGLPQQNLSKWGIASANFSGITPLGDGRYAIVSDKGDADGFYVWKIDQDPETGKILSIENEGFRENKVNPTSGRVSGFGTTYVFGVPEVCAIPGGRLLVLEREANVPNVYVGADVICKLYSVKPRRSNAISPDAVLAQLPDDAFLEKTLVAQWNTVLSNLSVAWANYEGMCLGAKLSNGKHTLILISDSQGGYGKGPFHLQDYIKVIVLDN